MDETIAKWIIEFLLRRKIDDTIINSVISSIPIPNQDYRLKKTILLRRIETEIANGCVSEKIMELIEIIEGLDHENGKTVSDLLKEAYCLVAVDCTVRFLGESVEENKRYLEMVELLWKNRVCKSEGLVSELSKKWLEDIELAWKDSSVCEKIWMRNTRNEALRAVKAYLKEAWECFGPSFLELVAAKAGKEVEGLRFGNAGGGIGGGDVIPSGNPIRELVSFDGSQKGQGVIRRKHVASKRRRPRGPKISDADDADMNNAGDGIPEVTRPQHEAAVDKTKEVLSSSPKKIPAMGEDHHSDNLQNDQALSPTGPSRMENVVEAELVGGKVPEITRPRDETPEVDKVNEIMSSSQKPPSVGEDHHSVDLRYDQTSPFTGPTSKESVVEAVQVRYKILESGETVKIHRALRNSTRELHDAVIDPLSEALEKAQTLVSSLSRNNRETNGVQNAERPETVVLNTEKDVGPSKQAGNETDASKGLNEKELENVNQAALDEEARGNVTLAFGIEKNPRKRSLMEPNDTSHNYQWDDEIENSSASPTRRKLPSPKIHRISPLKIPGYRNGRRERKRWTPLEEDTLREGVMKYGRGNWKMIMLDSKFSEVFQGRTEVDLKDKWRNLTRQKPSRVEPILAHEGRDYFAKISIQNYSFEAFVVNVYVAKILIQNYSLCFNNASSLRQGLQIQSDPKYQRSG
ncbi:hypothetical protein KSS87_009844 [Heliosperma pusillum]|nr:hypothetical protein KSS87_009844 [Heliosperma pusillum]